MTDLVQPASKARREVLRVALGLGAAVIARMAVRASRADAQAYDAAARQKLRALRFDLVGLPRA